MPNIRRAKSVYLFTHGIVATCDYMGEQIPELQGSYSIDLHRRILLEALPDCDFMGFEILPSSFIESVNTWYIYYKDKDLSWDEINNL
jgi:hypothetical protein